MMIVKVGEDKFEVSDKVYAKCIERYLKKENIKWFKNYQNTSYRYTNYLIVEYNGELRCIYYDGDDTDPDIKDTKIVDAKVFEKVLNRQGLWYSWCEDCCGLTAKMILEYHEDNVNKVLEDCNVKINYDADVIKEQIDIFNFI